MILRLRHGVSLGLDRSGTGTPMILVHGAWSDRNTWTPILAGLSAHFQILSYDRRGYGESLAPNAGLEGHVRDLLELIQALELGRVIVVGSSLGAVVALSAFLRAEDRFSRVVLHEPPLLTLLEHERQDWPTAKRIRKTVQLITDAVLAQDLERASQLYVEGINGYPGSWEFLPEPLKAEFVRHAGNFVPDADALEFPIDALRSLEPANHRVRVTRSERSAPYLRRIADTLSTMLLGKAPYVFRGAGHVAHQSQPEGWVRGLLELLVYGDNSP